MEDNVLITEAMKCLYGGRELHDLTESKDEDKITDEAEREYRKMRSRATGKVRPVEDEEDELEEATMTPSRKAEMERIAAKLPEKDFKERYGERWKSVKIATATKLMKQKRGIEEDMNYYTEMINILSEAGFIEDEEDYLQLAEAAMYLLEGSDEEYRSRLARGHDVESARRAGAELASRELKAKIGKGGLGHKAYAPADYYNKDRQKDAQRLRSIRDVRKEPADTTARQRRIKELSAKYRTEEVEYLVDYLIDEGYVADVNDAIDMMNYLSEDTIELILTEGYKSKVEAKRGLSSAKRSAHKKSRQSSHLRPYDYEEEEDEDDKD
jgi:hypothetical protein